MYEWLQKKLKLAHHRHTGRLLPHKHSSNGALVIIMLVVGIILVVASQALLASADTIDKSRSLKLRGVVPGPAPTQAAVILQPTPEKVFNSLPIDVSGTCQSDTFILIYKNHTLGATTICIDGVFGAKITLIKGGNVLKVRTMDSLGQFGPDSQKFSVTYDPHYVPGSPSIAATDLLVVSLESNSFNATTQSPYNLNLNIAGGKPPYAVSVRWGDGTEDLLSRLTAGSFSLNHSYHQPNIETLQISVSDSLGQKDAVQSVVVVSGIGLTTGGSATTNPPSSIVGSTKSTIDLIWPIYTVAMAGVALFWLGEKYQISLLHSMWKTSRNIHIAKHR